MKYDDASTADDVYHRLSEKYRSQGTPVIYLLTQSAAREEMETYKRHASENDNQKREPSYSRGTSERSRSSSSRHATSPRPSGSRRRSRSENENTECIFLLIISFNS
jgi:hypothetical protein